MRYKFVHDCCRFYWNDTVRILPLSYCIAKYEYCKVLYAPYYRTYCGPHYSYCTRTFYEYLLLVPTTYYLPLSTCPHPPAASLWVLDLGLRL